MLRRVPASTRDIHSSGERQTVIDDHEFLMMAGARRMCVVESQMNPRMAKRIHTPHQLRIAHVREQEGKVPDQDVDVEIRLAGYDGWEEVPERWNQRYVTSTRTKSHSAVEVPSGNEHRSSRPRDGFREHSVI